MAAANLILLKKQTTITKRIPPKTKQIIPTAKATSELLVADWTCVMTDVTLAQVLPLFK